MLMMFKMYIIMLNQESNFKKEYKTKNTLFNCDFDDVLEITIYINMCQFLIEPLKGLNDFLNE